MSDASGDAAGGWCETSTSRHEHVDVVPELENLFARERLPFDAVVITATQCQSDVEDHQIWLELSPDATQVELDGGHNVYRDDPAGVAAEIIRLLDEAAGGS